MLKDIVSNLVLGLRTKVSPLAARKHTNNLDIISAVLYFPTNQMFIYKTEGRGRLRFGRDNDKDSTVGEDILSLSEHPLPLGKELGPKE